MGCFAMPQHRDLAVIVHFHGLFDLPFLFVEFLWWLPGYDGHFIFPGLFFFYFLNGNDNI